MLDKALRWLATPEEFVLQRSISKLVIGPRLSCPEPQKQLGNNKLEMQWVGLVLQGSSLEKHF